jgi:hypothetical protein
MFECSREQSKPRQLLKQKRVINAQLANGSATSASSAGQSTNNGQSSPSLNSKRNQLLNGGKSSQASTYKDEINVDNLDFTKKILHTSWHPKDNIIAIAATNNLYLFYNKEASSSAMHSVSSSSSSTSSNSSSTCSNSSTSYINSNNNTNNSTNPNAYFISNNCTNSDLNNGLCNSSDIINNNTTNLSGIGFSISSNGLLFFMLFFVF